MRSVAGEHVVIERRFNGPPASGHGGWSAGLAADLVDGVAEVTLRRPPPLETPLAVARDGDTVELRDDDAVVLAARPVPRDDLAPAHREERAPLAEPVDLATATAASARFAWHTGHPFPTCFGCGPERDPDDALRLFCGPVGDGRFAVPWTPPAWTAGRDGHVLPGFVWAALDCPSSAPAHATIAAPVVLGRLSIELVAPVVAGAPHVIQAWLARADGRKRETVVALHAADGARLAVGRAVWIELARPLAASR